MEMIIVLHAYFSKVLDLLTSPTILHFPPKILAEIYKGLGLGWEGSDRNVLHLPLRFILVLIHCQTLLQMLELLSLSLLFPSNILNSANFFLAFLKYVFILAHCPFPAGRYEFTGSL